MLLPVLVNARWLAYSKETSKPATTNLAAATTNLAAARGKGLNLEQIFHVLSIPSCRTLTIFMMLTGTGP
jgi:hypothetical protein